MEMEEIITSGLREMGLEGRVPDDAPSRLARYGRLLLEKNQVMNLTASREADLVARLHMLDCAALLSYADLAGKTLIDVGTGAGFPGMVLKILVPSLPVTLLDSLNKRLAWLERVAAALGLTGVTTVHARGEELAHDPAFRSAFDFASARAVADLSVLAELLAGLLGRGKRSTAAATGLWVVVFCGVAGNTPSVTRAAVMISFFPIVRLPLSFPLSPQRSGRRQGR